MRWVRLWNIFFSFLNRVSRVEGSRAPAYALSQTAGSAFKCSIRLTCLYLLPSQGSLVSHFIQIPGRPVEEWHLTCEGTATPGTLNKTSQDNGVLAPWLTEGVVSFCVRERCGVRQCNNRSLCFWGGRVRVSSYSTC